MRFFIDWDGVMTTRAALEEISRFLKSTDPEVLCITGKWGVGKTFGWNRHLKQAVVERAVSLERYAYISLFGVNSLEAFKYAIFEATVPIDQISEGPNFKSLDSSLKAIEGFGRRGLALANMLPGAKNIFAGAGPSIFLAVRNQIICVDDLERAGKGLEVKDVLGLVSFLKEQRHCKVVLLLNRDQLGEAKDDFDKQLEKVIDSRVAFDPTAREAAEIAVVEGAKYSEYLKSFCVMLGIVNLRVIKKIEKLAERLAARLADFDPLVLRQAIHTAVLFGWSHYQRDGSAPSPEFIRSYRSFKYSVGDAAKKATDQEKFWHALLQRYAFSNVDEFDAVLIDGIEAGHFDWEKISAAANVVQKQVDNNRLDSSFSDAWRSYHDSFSSPAEEVLKKIGDAFYKSVKTISPVNLNGTVKLFKDLGRSDEARALVEYYVKSREESPAFFDLGKHPGFHSDITDPDVRRAFAEKAASFNDDLTPRQILHKIAEHRGWSESDIEVLLTVTPEGFKEIFKASEGEVLHKMIQAALQFGNYVGQG